MGFPWAYGVLCLGIVHCGGGSPRSIPRSIIDASQSGYSDEKTAICGLWSQPSVPAICRIVPIPARQYDASPIPPALNPCPPSSSSSSGQVQIPGLVSLIALVRLTTQLNNHQHPGRQLCITIGRVSPNSQGRQRRLHHTTRVQTHLDTAPTRI